MRKTKPKKRILVPDPKFNDVLVTRFVNNFMMSGKKSVLSTFFMMQWKLLNKNQKNLKVHQLDIWKKALENITPQVEVKSRRVGGATFQVPMEIRPDRKISLSMKNLILFAQETRRTFHERKTCRRNNGCL